MRINLIIILKMKKLYDININIAVKVINIDSYYSSLIRLSEMGIIPGTVIRIVKKTPFGGPIQLRLNNYYVAIRKEDAKMINVTI